MARRDPDEIMRLAVEIKVPGTRIAGDLAVPDRPKGVVLFAHGTGSGRHSPRNRRVAAALQARGFSTLLIDLLTRDEEQVDYVTAHLRFDIEMLSDRLVHAALWLEGRDELAGLPLALFGASTGVAAALVASVELAARDLDAVAVVGRGGRPDLAREALPLVTAPTLLIVGGDDQTVLDINERAKARMVRAKTDLVIVPGATHLFAEPGALERVTVLAGRFIDRCVSDLGAGGPGVPPRLSSRPPAASRPPLEP